MTSPLLAEDHACPTCAGLGVGVFAGSSRTCEACGGSGSGIEKAIPMGWRAQVRAGLACLDAAAEAAPEGYALSLRYLAGSLRRLVRSPEAPSPAGPGGSSAAGGGSR